MRWFLPFVQTVRAALGFGPSLPARPAGPPSAARPTVHIPTPEARRSKSARPQGSADGRALEAARRRARFSMPAGTASTLRKVMRLRRIENGTRGRDTMSGWSA